jgi:hypothetical protein
MTQSNMQRSEQTYDQEWIERVGKTVYDLACNCTNNDYIIKSKDPALLGRIELAIEQHLDSMPTKLKPTLQQIIVDIKARKESLER